MQAAAKSKFENCTIFTKDDKFLSHCSRKKYNWYVKKNLVDIVSDKIIKLKFDYKLKGNAKTVNEMPKSEIQTQCVVCGLKNDLIKFHIVPMEFRQYFPIEMKSHTGHNRVTICKICHGEVCSLYSRYREELFERFNISLNKQKYDLKMASNVYLKFFDTIDVSRDITRNVIISYFGHKPTIEELKKLQNINVYDGITCSSPGEQIV